MPDQNGNLVKRIDMAIHVMELCAEHKIKVRFTLEQPATGYVADRQHRTIKTRPVRNTGFYVSALHEIGHIVGEHQTVDDSRLMQEWYAWRFAKETALTWTDTAERVMKRALSSYCNSANIRQMPDEFFDWVFVTRNGAGTDIPVSARCGVENAHP